MIDRGSLHRNVSNIHLDFSSILPSPSLGLFWFARTERQTCVFVGAARSFVEVAEIAGFRTLEEGHVEIWPFIQRRESYLRSYEYEDFPRGRVNWIADENTWLLLLDQKLNSQPYIKRIVECWRIPTERLRVAPDPHYRSSERVGSPENL
ncbi:hypothetical protein [Salinarimonas soli]|uniref:Uncharacterized protein n=1 Tax=Salinarimonas soli TaxID=1638099 RepID=A0A5B2VBT5_9HYPH|nr:hypothetical protein [Salinarimonas soli]KAA2235882.1 hypothetical protein F0L46_17745 [Salinarimonas soli]